MKLIAIVTAFKNRRRAGIDFPKRQEVKVPLTGEDDPVLAKLEADKVLKVIVKEVGDDETASEPADAADAQRAELKEFLAGLDEKPNVEPTKDAMGFDVSGKLITELWKEIQAEKSA